jgi:DNA-binding HxlR family transcriptional regulator
MNIAEFISGRQAAFEKLKSAPEPVTFKALLTAIDELARAKLLERTP